MTTKFTHALCLLALTMNLCAVGAQSDTLNQPGVRGKLIDIGGWRLHLYGKGLANDDGPTVVFENGIRGFSFDWCFVQPEVALFAKTYTYDRAGSAWSDLGPRPHTMQQSVYNLHTLLKNANVPPPYVLVGASLGGLLVRLFAQQYPGEVVGMVLLDAGYENGVHYIDGNRVRPATDATGKPIPSVKTVATLEDNNLARSPEAVKAIGDALRTMGYPFKRVEFPYNKLPDSVQALRLWALNQFEYYAANDNNFVLEEKAQMIRERDKQLFMLGDMPLVVVTAEQSPVASDPEEAERRTNQAAMTNLSRNSKQVIASGSTHEIHVDQPGIVINAIKQVVEAVRKNGKLED